MEILMRLTVQLNKQDYEVHGYKLEEYTEQVLMIFVSSVRRDSGCEPARE